VTGQAPRPPGHAGQARDPMPSAPETSPPGLSAESPDLEAMARALEPMRAVAARALPSGPDWAYEVKWDGMRVLAYVDGGQVRARSRSGRDVTAAFPELADVAAALGPTRAVLDGEVVAFGPDGKPDFDRLAHRMHVADAAAARRLAGRIPVSYLVFDLLFLDGRATTALPYDERRALLARLPGLTLSEQLPGTGAEVLRASAAAGLEGIVAKRRSSAYLPGRRGDDWVKVKNVRTQSVVIGGWQPGAGTRANRIGSLLVGVAEPSPPGPAQGPSQVSEPSQASDAAETSEPAETSELSQPSTRPPTDGPPKARDSVFRYAGHVGTGFSAATLDLLDRLLGSLRAAEPPFPDVPADAARTAVWVRPELVAEVEYARWTPDNRLRHPSFKGLRDDLTPADTTPEPP